MLLLNYFQNCLDGLFLERFLQVRPDPRRSVKEEPLKIDDVRFTRWTPFLSPNQQCQHTNRTQLNGSMKEPNISIYFFFPPITQWCSISDVLFTGRRGVSDFSVLKYY